MKSENKKIRHKQSMQKKKKIKNVTSNIHMMIKSLLADALDYRKKKQLEQASFIYQQVLQQEPENICALNGLGLIALDAGMLVLASEFFKSAHVTSTNHTTVNKNLALVYTKLADYEKAIKHFSYILDTDKNNGEIHGELARLYQQSGESNIALDYYRSAFELNPADPRNFQGMVQLDAGSVTAENINMVEKYLLKPNLSLEVRCSFYFSLGAVYDVSEKYDEAFANYAVANISKVATFDGDQHIKYISDIIQTFSSEFFEQQQSAALNNSAQPVFIVGMPQSGIASADQLLSNHGGIYSAGELNLIENIAQKFKLTADGMINPMSSEDIDGELLADYSKFYLNHINAMALDDNYKVPARTIDRRSSNFLHLGLIALLFPKARIIHCVANPLDICLSNYFRNYSADNKYSYDQKNIVLYYQQYERLMAHWNNVLPGKIHTVNYDDMVKSPEAASRELFNFVEIVWQPECIEIVGSVQHVKANHGIQVRHGGYKSPARHWRNYRKYTHAMINELMLFNVTETSSKTINLR